MSYDTPELTDQEVLQHAYSTLQEHLPLQAHGYTCTTADLLKVLLGVAVTRGTSESVCADLVGTPDSASVAQLLGTLLAIGSMRCSHDTGRPATSLTNSGSAPAPSGMGCC